MDNDCFPRPRRRIQRVAAGILIVSAIASLAGCGGGSNVARVSGTITLDGQPLTSGTVHFVPSEGRAAKGKIAPDGTYRLGTFGEADGALLGTHQVAIVAYEPVEIKQQGPPFPKPTNKPLVPPKYLEIGSSGLTFTVEPGRNTADFELTTK
jgi:hypothetical protein